MMSTNELTRRRFLAHTGAATVAAGSLAVMRATPVGASEYYVARPTIAVSPSAARALGGAHPSSMFGLHPAASRISGLYDQGKVAIVNSAGLLVDTRSHFDAQAYMEAGVEDTTLSATGWAGRWLAATASQSDHPLRSVAIGGALPASLRGGDAVAASGFGSLSLFSWGPSAALVTANTIDLYGRSGVHPLLATWAQPTIDTIANIRARQQPVADRPVDRGGVSRRGRARRHVVVGHPRRHGLGNRHRCAHVRAGIRARLGTRCVLRPHRRRRGPGDGRRGHRVRSANL